jgi:putative Holliday junction resolvase
LITAQGLDSIYRKDLKYDLDAISELIKRHGVTEVVVGLPLNMNGSYSAKTKEVIEFLDMLSKTISVPTKTWDERLTTVQAQKALLEADTSRAKRKHLADKLAAQLILQSYLDSRKKEGIDPNA